MMVVPMFLRLAATALAAVLSVMRPVNAQQDITSWIKVTKPSQIVLTITPTAPSFATCAEMTFKLALTNTASHKIVTVQGQYALSYFKLVDAAGSPVKPTGVIPSVDTSIAYLEIQPNETVALGSVEPKYLNAPFTASDCKSGEYTASLDLNLPGAFMVKSKAVQVRIGGA